MPKAEASPAATTAAASSSKVPTSPLPGQPAKLSARTGTSIRAAAMRLSQDLGMREPLPLELEVAAGQACGERIAGHNVEPQNQRDQCELSRPAALDEEQLRNTDHEHDRGQRVVHNGGPSR